MSPGGAEIWHRVDGGGLILNVQSLTLAHAYVIRAVRDGIETQVGASTPPVTRPHVHPCTRISTLGVDGHPQAGGLGHTYVHTRKCSLTPIWHSHDCLTPRLMSLGVNKALSLAHL